MSLRYQNTDIQKLSQDLIAALGGYTPGTGVSVLSGLNKASLERSTSVGNIDGFKLVSVQNTGEADGILMGAIIHPGEVITLPSILSDLYEAIDYDATGTELLILTVKKSI